MMSGGGRRGAPRPHHGVEYYVLYIIFAPHRCLYHGVIYIYYGYIQSRDVDNYCHRIIYVCMFKYILHMFKYIYNIVSQVETKGDVSRAVDIYCQRASLTGAPPRWYPCSRTDGKLLAQAIAQSPQSSNLSAPVKTYHLFHPIFPPAFPLPTRRHPQALD